jgi:hypothetical protein
LYTINRSKSITRHSIPQLGITNDDRQSLADFTVIVSHDIPTNLEESVIEIAINNSHSPFCRPTEGDDSASSRNSYEFNMIQKNVTSEIHTSNTSRVLIVIPTIQEFALPKSQTMTFKLNNSGICRVAISPDAILSRPIDCPTSNAHL